MGGNPLAKFALREYEDACNAKGGCVVSRHLFAIGGRIHGRSFRLLTAPGADRREKAVAPADPDTLGNVDGTGSRLSRRGQAVIPSPRGRLRLPLVGPATAQVATQPERVEGPHLAPVAQLVRAGSRTRDPNVAGSSPAGGECRLRGMVSGEIPGRGSHDAPLETPRNATPFRDARPLWPQSCVSPSAATGVARSHLFGGGS